MKLVLANPSLTETQVLRVLANTRVPDCVVAAIAQHTKWSCQYNVRMALMRNGHTPVASALSFLSHIILCDLTDISKLEGLAPHLKKYIVQESAAVPWARPDQRSTALSGRVDAFLGAT